MTTTNLIENLPRAQRDRLIFIEIRLLFLGAVKRADVMRRFGVAEAATTRDFAEYRKIAPENLNYDSAEKAYTISGTFSRLLSATLSDRDLMRSLVHGMGDDLSSLRKPLVPCELPTPSEAPDIEVVSAITRSINNGTSVHITYHSMSGVSSRTIAPFALAGNGLRWHARAYDRQTGEFRDFVLNRIAEASELKDDQVDPEKETREHDIQWNRIVELEIVPHPNLPDPSFVEMELRMDNGFFRLNTRASLAGYILRLRGVDCSKNAKLDPKQYHLWLKNRPALYGVNNLAIAPGYEED